MSNKYIFITGGVFSSLGKGITASSIASILEERGISVNILKIDPYLNINPGLMNPNQHGEIYITEDGTETDLDLGHYERFTNIRMTKDNNITAGQIYRNIILKERKGFYLGNTVQVIPHITDEIQSKIYNIGRNFDVNIIEIGGTVGDIESLPFLEAIRQFSLNIGVKNSIFLHLTLVPWVNILKEFKTKPSQHSVKELRSIGINPDILLCRVNSFLKSEDIKKISLFTNIDRFSIFSVIDVKNIYLLPLILFEQKLDNIILKKLNISANRPTLYKWHIIEKKIKESKNQVNIGIIIKYTKSFDAYRSLVEALCHAGIKNKILVKVKYIDSQIIKGLDDHIFNDIDGILIPGGFGVRGINGKIIATRFARINKIPFFGICLGFHISIIEYARYVKNLKMANSLEFLQNCKTPVITLYDNNYNKMRLGLRKSFLIENSFAQKLYKQKYIYERYRHKYIFNKKYLNKIFDNKMIVSCCSYGENNQYFVEMIEMIDHPWFIASQFHPEYTSKPDKGHPLFNSFILNSYKKKKETL